LKFQATNIVVCLWGWLLEGELFTGLFDWLFPLGTGFESNGEWFIGVID
jgi:hypothetical protein